MLGVISSVGRAGGPVALEGLLGGPRELQGAVALLVFDDRHGHAERHDAGRVREREFDAAVVRPAGDGVRNRDRGVQGVEELAVVSKAGKAKDCGAAGAGRRGAEHGHEGVEPIVGEVEV